MLQYLVFVGAAVNLWGAFAYIKDTLYGKTRPNRVTWLLWAVAPAIGVTAALTKGVGWAVLPVFMAGFGPLLVFICSFINKNAYWQLTLLDYGCGFLSLLALVLWAVTKEPNVAILLAILSDALAALPTLVKSWTDPETESSISFTTGFINAATSLFAVKLWNFSELAFPVYLMSVCLLLVIFIERKRFYRLIKNSPAKINPPPR